MQTWMTEHDEWLTKCAAYRSLRFKLRRLALLKVAEQWKIVNGALAKHLRRAARCRVSPIIADRVHSMPTDNPDTTPIELQAMIETVPSSYRGDVAAECWIVRAEHPTSSAKAVFRLAMRNCMNARRGVYSRAEEKRNEVNGRPRSIESCRMRVELTAAQWWVSTIDNEYRSDRLALVNAMIRANLAPDIVESLLRCETQAEAAKSIGISVDTLQRRLNGIRVSAPIIAAIAPMELFRRRETSSAK